MSSLGSLTKQEKEQLIEIDKKYEPSFKAVRDKLMKLDIETDSELYFQVCEEENEIHDKWMKERGEIHKKAEVRAFRNFGGDVETIAEAVKNQIPTYIMMAKILAGEKPTEQEETHRQSVIDAIKKNEKLLKEHPDDQELIEATNGLKDILNNLPLQTTYEITFSDETLRNNINDSFRIYLEFLKKANINVYKDVQRFIDYLIANKERLDELYTLEPINEKDILNAKNNTSRKNRTRKNLDDNVITFLPTQIVTITGKQGYSNGISLYQQGNAYLQPLTSTDNLKFKDGKIFFSGQLEAISEAELQNMKTKEYIEDIDLPLLRIFYSIILTYFEKDNVNNSTGNMKRPRENITMYIPDFAEYIGKKRNAGKKEIDDLIAKVQKFHHVVGILHVTSGGRNYKNIYPVLNFEGYNNEKNTISFSSPYMNHIIETIYEISIRKNKAGKAELQSNGKALTDVTHSYLVNADIAKERNKVAVENVFIIITLIEQCGDKLPHMAASTIIDRNPQLKKRLENSSNPSQLLQRVFKKTWELLREKTKLMEVYKNIHLPDPNDISNIPTIENVNKIVFYFPHDGKQKK